MFVFPMVGLSRRFSEAGYTLPKYMLQAHGQSLLGHSLAGFAAYFEDHPFLFVVRDVHGTPDFVIAEARRLGVRDTRIVVLDAPTNGQAETVALGLRRHGVADRTPITIFNIDTFRPGFRHPTEFAHDAVDGYLEVFRGSGANWSYVQPDPQRNGRVASTTEKVPVSDLCCTGLYHFSAAASYLRAYEEFSNGGALGMGLKELFVAPMYNLLIRDGKDIRFHVIDPADVVFCGVPVEYEEFLCTGYSGQPSATS